MTALTAPGCYLWLMGAADSGTNGAHAPRLCSDKQVAAATAAARLSNSSNAVLSENRFPHIFVVPFLVHSSHSSSHNVATILELSPHHVSPQITVENIQRTEGLIRDLQQRLCEKTGSCEVLPPS